MAAVEAVFEEPREGVLEAYLVMPYYAGGDLAAFFRTAPAPDRAAVLLLQVGAAVARSFTRSFRRPTNVTDSHFLSFSSCLSNGVDTLVCAYIHVCVCVRMV